jgi:hypothetical protein
MQENLDDHRLVLGEAVRAISGMMALAHAVESDDFTANERRRLHELAGSGVIATLWDCMRALSEEAVCEKLLNCWSAARKRRLASGLSLAASTGRPSKGKEKVLRKLAAFISEMLPIAKAICTTFSRAERDELRRQAGSDIFQLRDLLSSLTSETARGFRRDPVGTRARLA